MRIAGAALILTGLVRAAGAQDDTCRPGPASNEARTMAKFGVPLAFGPGVAQVTSTTVQVYAGIDLTYLPKVDDATATPTFCRPDKPGPENTDLLLVAPRPRVWLTLPGGWGLEGSWIPPLRMGEVKANLVGVAVSRTLDLSRSRLSLSLRAHATVGRIEGPITCDDEALQDSASPCYQGTRSNDSFSPNILGGSVAVAWTASGSIRPYLGAGYNHLAPRFQVNFLNRFGGLDRRKVIVDLDRMALFAGATWTANGRVDLSGEIYSAPTDAVTARVVGRFRLRGSEPGPP